MAEAVYLLCALTSAACCGLLVRGYFASRARFLFWCALSFAGWAANNALLVIDLVALPDRDLSLARTILAVIAIVVLLYGLCFATEER